MPSISDEQMAVTSRRGQRIPQDVLDSLGSIEMQARPKLTLFYRPDQARDKGGKWTDEGKGSEEPGYVHPGDSIDKSGKAAKVSDADEKDAQAGIQRGVARVDSAADRQAFQDGLQRTIKEHPFGAAVQHKDPEFYQDSKTQLYLSKDKLAGVAVAPDGDLVSGFRHPSSSADFNEVLDVASPHATHLDCFATNGKLPELYAKHGFKPVVRIPFDPKQAPDDWPKEADAPDVLLMAHDPDNELGLPDITAKGYKAVEKDIPVEKDYNKARYMQLRAAIPPLTGIDKRIIDYKPESRPLDDPTKLYNLASILPNTRYVSYSKMPFFNAISAMQGVDPNTVSGLDYKKSRDKFFNKLPVVDVPVGKTVVTQRSVNKDKIAEMAKFPLGIGTSGTPVGPIQVVRYKDENYILNGHHRLADLVLKGAKTIKANALTITDPEIKTYEWGAKTKPVFDKMINEVSAATHGKALTVPLKTIDRVRQKLLEKKYKNDPANVKDIVRGRILANDDKHMHEIASALEQRLGVKPKYTDDPESGFRDYKFTPVINGRMVEIGVMTNGIHEATMQTHGPYEEKQMIERNAENENRNLTPEEMAKVTLLNNKMKAILGQGAAHAASVEQRESH